MCVPAYEQGWVPQLHRMWLIIRTVGGMQAGSMSECMVALKGVEAESRQPHT